MDETPTLADHELETIGFLRPDGSYMLKITEDGRLVPGEGLSADQATREVFDTMARLWPELIEEWARNRHPQG